MAGASIRIDHNSAQVADGFTRLRDRAGDLSPAMRRISGHMLFAAQRRFEREAGPGGIPWQPLAPSTIARNPRRAPPAKILRDSNRLYSSLTSDSDATSAVAGTNVIYAGIHQGGGEIKRAAGKRTANFRLATRGAARGRNGVRYGSKLRFASAKSRAQSLHQRSFDVPAYSIRMPARPFLGFDAADDAAILDIIGDEIDAAIGGAP